MNVNENLIEKDVMQINGEITINVDVSVKSFMLAKKIMDGILIYVVLKIFRNYYG